MSQEKGIAADLQGDGWSLCSLADAPIGYRSVRECVAYRSFLVGRDAEKNPSGLFLWDLLTVLLYC